jgi:hypothetical protein
MTSYNPLTYSTKVAATREATGAARQNPPSPRICGGREEGRKGVGEGTHKNIFVPPPQARETVKRNCKARLRRVRRGEENRDADATACACYAGIAIAIA